MTDSTPRITPRKKDEASRLRLVSDRPGGGAISGLYLGQFCHNHVLTDLYGDFGTDGHLTDLHTSDVGSC